MIATPVHGVAQIAALPSAAMHRPQVLVAPNGVPMVNITAPSAAGVLRNIYGQFDVDRRGAILNNSRAGPQTRLDGALGANPWLTNGAARIILNEVRNASSRSIVGRGNFRDIAPFGGLGSSALRVGERLVRCGVQLPHAATSQAWLRGTLIDAGVTRWLAPCTGELALAQLMRLVTAPCPRLGAGQTPGVLGEAAFNP